MSSQNDAALVAVDWGTSRLRVLAIDSKGRVVARSETDQGMSSTRRECFQEVLREHLTLMKLPTGLPVIMCGMVGSRQGWAEAGYLPLPALLSELADQAVRVPFERYDVRILPGISRLDRRRPDVMRGEETHLIGLSDRLEHTANAKHVVCMPGTHSKWVHLVGDTVQDFATSMTGDMFAALSRSSILNRSLGTEAVDPSSAEFKSAVSASVEEPWSILSRLFSIRSSSLLFGLRPDEASARLSGYLIGQEIAGVKMQLPVGARIELVGSGLLGALYRQALVVAGIECTVHDGEELVVEGLKRAASTIWRTEFA